MRIYFSGIGGVGIGPLAEIAVDAGYDVTGSDRIEGLMTRKLHERGISIHIGEQDGDYLRAAHREAPIDWFVHTAALTEDHPEYVAAKELGIATGKRDEVVADIVARKNLKLIAVAGTHGKTTTTGMLVWTLKQLNIPVSYSIGTTISYGPSGQFDPASEYFVYECDEFDRNFLHFHPELSIVTAVDYDHPDTYPTESDYKAAFQQFISQSAESFLWQRDADYIGGDLPHTHVLQPADVIDIGLAGAHNRRNATLALKALHTLGLGDAAANTEALERFPGGDRRFERLQERLYSDYGLHPVEISATLQLARELSDRVTLVFQPHQNLRQHEIKDGYTDDVFADAHTVYWVPTYLSRENPDLHVFTPAELTAQLSPDRVRTAELDDDLWQRLQEHLNEGDLVVCMGAGTIDGWVRSHVTD